MIKNKMILLFALSIFSVVLVTGCSNQANVNFDKDEVITKSKVVGEPENGLGSIDSGSTSSGDVSVELTPIEITNTKLVVEIAVNTHSVDLTEFDLMKLTSLEYDGKTVKPTSAPSLTGHHSSGELVFNIDKEINEFKVKINDIPKVDERIFEWR